MRPRRFDLIAFDWDGTLFDSTAIIVRCIQAAVVDVGGARLAAHRDQRCLEFGLRCRGVGCLCTSEPRGQMTEILFYHLEAQPLEKVLPVLLEKSLERGWSAIVEAG